jgi:cystathionine beta-lyase/cystathionine gamma-synthase
MKFSTRAIHVGQAPEKTTGAVVPPIFQTTTYAQSDLGVHKGYDYSRATNPTRAALEANLASLEGADHGIAFASGLAALSAIVQHFKAGDHFILSENVYGGTYRALTQVFDRFDVRTSWIDTTQLSNIEAAIGPDTKAVIVETPTNPMMSITDIKGVSDLAHAQGLICIVDNTFLTSYCQRPLELGADVVFHSTTKYITGHSDVIGGIVLTSDQKLAEDLAFIQKSLGAVPSPFDCWLTSRSLKTLPVRMDRHNYNAGILAAYLERRSAVGKIFYPGLASHPQHGLAARQQIDPDGKPVFGGMLSIDVGDLGRASKIARNLKIFTLAESLGGVESLINHPATMTHATVPEEQRARLGITDGLLRLSVGIEAVEDLQEDLEQALAAL